MILWRSFYIWKSTCSLFSKKEIFSKLSWALIRFNINTKPPNIFRSSQNGNQSERLFETCSNVVVSHVRMVFWRENRSGRGICKGVMLICISSRSHTESAGQMILSAAQWPHFWVLRNHSSPQWNVESLRDSGSSPYMTHCRRRSCKGTWDVVAVARTSKKQTNKDTKQQ